MGVDMEADLPRPEHARPRNTVKTLWGSGNQIVAAKRKGGRGGIPDERFFCSSWKKGCRSEEQVKRRSETFSRSWKED
jgi:hypothetical protein